jgi:hypothetical protein
MWVILNSDWSGIEKELKRLKSIPTTTDKRRLDRVLEFGLSRTRQDVHIETGSLRSSGKAKSVMLLGRYSGTLRYGGPSAGINNPVDYAIFELDRGGPHDFMRSTALLHPLWVEAIKEIMTK